MVDHHVKGLDELAEVRKNPLVEWAKSVWRAIVTPVNANGAIADEPDMNKRVEYLEEMVDSMASTILSLNQSVTIIAAKHLGDKPEPQQERPPTLARGAVEPQESISGPEQATGLRLSKSFDARGLIQQCKDVKVDPSQATPKGPAPKPLDLTGGTS